MEHERPLMALLCLIILYSAWFSKIFELALYVRTHFLAYAHTQAHSHVANIKLQQGCVSLTFLKEE